MKASALMCTVLLATEGCHSLLLMRVCVCVSLSVNARAQMFLYLLCVRVCMCKCICALLTVSLESALVLKTASDLYSARGPSALRAREEWNNFITVESCQKIFITLLITLASPRRGHSSEDLYKTFS